ncbi:MAG: hypothetical protein QG597_1287 [Actinomycetota bacterium]|nr:hypothetical protein [Actinomycetota bacterium]
MGQDEVAESINVKATAATVWPMISDPANYGRWSPEATGVKRRTGRGAWQVGDRFVGGNKAWLAWSTACTVVAADPEHGEFAFDVDFAHVPIARWSYTVADSGDGGCLVTETWTDRRSGVIGALIKPSGVFIGRGLDAAVRNRRTMRATLLALKAEAESHA